MELHKLIVGLYSPTEIAEPKRLLIQEFAMHLEDCQYKTVRRQSVARSAHDAEVEVILCILELIDNRGLLDKKVRFVAVLFDRVSKYGPNEINVFAGVDRQIIID